METLHVRTNACAIPARFRFICFSWSGEGCRSPLKTRTLSQPIQYSTPSRVAFPRDTISDRVPARIYMYVCMFVDDTTFLPNEIRLLKTNAAAAGKTIKPDGAGARRRHEREEIHKTIRFAMSLLILFLLAFLSFYYCAFVCRRKRSTNNSGNSRSKYNRCCVRALRTHNILNYNGPVQIYV